MCDQSDTFIFIRIKCYKKRFECTVLKVKREALETNTGKQQAAGDLI